MARPFLALGHKLLAAAATLLALTAGAGAAAVFPRTTTTTPTQDTYVANGDFECGLAPWVVQVPDTEANYSIAAPGHASSSSFQVQFAPPARSPEKGVSARIISPPVRVVPGVPYRLTFWTWFNNPQAGFIGVQFNNLAYYTIDATDHGWGGDFTLNTVDYTPTNDTVTIKFEFLFNPVPSLDRIDYITFAPVQ
ncbi:hypothetical protein F5X97DRAFT_328224 [Nemania serpens]|nr:hypothetical protein F5X97DRAFT_328224 [Nemania serpens]